jgi:uncharacterized protein YecE (DUF72 family)
VSKVTQNPRFFFSANLSRIFTHERHLEKSGRGLSRGILPIQRAGRLACLLLQFLWSFRFTAGNREYVIELRRAFREFPLVAEMRHSGRSEEAIVAATLETGSRKRKTRFATIIRMVTLPNGKNIALACRNALT